MCIYLYTGDPVDAPRCCLPGGLATTKTKIICLRHLYWSANICNGWYVADVYSEHHICPPLLPWLSDCSRQNTSYRKKRNVAKAARI